MVSKDHTVDQGFYSAKGLYDQFRHFHPFGCRGYRDQVDPALEQVRHHHTGLARQSLDYLLRLTVDDMQEYVAPGTHRLLPFFFG